jgi:hypothetical protein
MAVKLVRRECLENCEVMRHGYEQQLSSQCQQIVRVAHGKSDGISAELAHSSQDFFHKMSQAECLFKETQLLIIN